MKIVLVWILISVANSSGVRTQSGELKFPTKEDCEIVRTAELNMLGTMVKTLGSWRTDQNLNVQYQSKCQQVNLVVSQ